MISSHNNKKEIEYAKTQRKSRTERQSELLSSFATKNQQFKTKIKIILHQVFVFSDKVKLTAG